MSLYLVFILVFILSMSRGSLAEFQPKVMPKSSIMRAQQLLMNCKNATAMLSEEIDTCEEQVTEVWRASRCRDVNAYMDAATARLNRLESHFAVLEAGIMKSSLNSCLNNTADEDEALQLKHNASMQELQLLNTSMMILIKEESDLRDEISPARNRSETLRCEEGKLKAEAEILKEHIPLNVASKGSNHLNISLNDVQKLLNEASKDREKALEDCVMAVEKLKEAHERCVVDVDLVQSMLDAYNTTIEDDKYSLKFYEFQAETCEYLRRDCSESRLNCIARQHAAEKDEFQSNTVLFERQSALAACTKASTSAHIEGESCEDNRREVVRELGLLGNHSFDNSQLSFQRCSDEMKNCLQHLGPIREEAKKLSADAMECSKQEKLCKNTTEECLTKMETIIDDHQALLDASARRAVTLHAKNEASYQCMIRGLRITSDVSFVREDTLRTSAELEDNEKIMATCRERKCV